MYLEILRLLATYLTVDIIDNVLRLYMGSKAEYAAFDSFKLHYNRTWKIYYDYHNKYGLGYPINKDYVTDLQYSTISYECY